MSSRDDHTHDHDDNHRDHDHTHNHGHGDSKSSSWVGPDGKVYHSHDGLAPHSHEPIYSSPGYFNRRAPPLVNRDFNESFHYWYWWSSWYWVTLIFLLHNIITNC